METPPIVLVPMAFCSACDTVLEWLSPIGVETRAKCYKCGYIVTVKMRVAELVEVADGVREVAADSASH